jgi:hypothetical protein
MYNTWRLHRSRIIDACQQQNLLPNHQEKSTGIDECPVNILSPMDYDNQSCHSPTVPRENRRKRELYLALLRITVTVWVTSFSLISMLLTGFELI